MSAKKSFSILSILSSIFLITSICGTAEAKSVYAITDHHAGTVRAYEIQGDKLVKPYWVEDWFSNASDVAIDSNLKLLFITFEASNIVWADAETLEQKGVLETPMMAGIVADEAKQRVYAITRGGNQLYVCEWDDAEEELVQLGIVTLADLSGAMGLTFDKITRRLYVANQTNTVNYYDADDPNWAHLGSRDVGWGAMDVAVDAVRGYLYSGGFWCGHTYLVKHDLECESNCNTETDIGTAVVGLAVDPAGGLVYCTTSDYKVRVYDCSGPNCVCTDSDPTDGGSGPAGICVESFGLLTLEKVDDVNDGNCVRPGDIITYTIDYNYPNEPNIGDINDVNIIDELPDEVDFNSASGPNCTQPDSNTVVWNIGTLSPGAAGSVTLTVEVKECVELCGIITNCCEIISGDQLLNSAEENTPFNYLVVEDFESYADEAEFEDVWGLTGSDIALEDIIVHSGDSSMKYEYTNDTVPYYTEADANTTGPNSLPIDTQDWTTAGIKALALYFYGNGGNDAEKMYVALRDTDGNLATVYYGNPNDLNEPKWHEWNIELNDFNDINVVNLSDVNKVYIGFGNRQTPTAGGSGTVYFDDIRLYPRRCVPLFGPDGDISFPFFAYDTDCFVDLYDFGVMAEVWRETDSTRVGSDAELKGGATWKTGSDCYDGNCIELDGDDDWVDLDDKDFRNFHNKTIAFWVKVMDYPTPYRYMFYFTDEDNVNPYRVNFVTRDPNLVRIRFIKDYFENFTADVIWSHMAFVLEDTAEGCTGRFYGDGSFYGEMTGQPRHSGDVNGVNLGSSNDGSSAFVKARFDDFRVYDRALTGDEVYNLYEYDTEPDANMLLYYDFDEGTGTTAQNSSTYEFYHPLVSEAELYYGEEVGSREINFRDLAILADNWLEEKLWP